MRRVVSGLIALAALGSCVSVRPGGEKIKLITDPDAPVPACQLLEEAHRLPMGGWSPSPYDARVDAILRNHAVEIGADTVLLRHTGPKSGEWYTKYYRCGPPQEKPK